MEEGVTAEEPAREPNGEAPPEHRALGADEDPCEYVEEIGRLACRAAWEREGLEAKGFAEPVVRVAMQGPGRYPRHPFGAHKVSEEVRRSIIDVARQEPGMRNVDLARAHNVSAHFVGTLLDRYGIRRIGSGFREQPDEAKRQEIIADAKTVGGSLKRIAARHGVSRETVGKLLRERGIERANAPGQASRVRRTDTGEGRKFAEAVRTNAEDMARRGLGAERIARDLGIDQGSAQRYVDQAMGTGG